MSDIFAPSAREAPAPLTHLPSAHALDYYNNNRAEWMVDAAPNAARNLLRGNTESIQLAWMFMQDDYKVAVWRALDRAGRKTVRAALDGSAAATINLDQVPA